MAKTELQQKAKKGTDDSKTYDNSSTIASSKNNNKNTPLYEFFLSGLKDMLYAESKLVEALQEMEQAATTEELKDAFEDHYLLTKKHVSRLKKILERLGENEESKEG